MNPETVLQIIKLSLEITLEIVRGMPQDVKEKLWREHLERMAWWENLFRKLMPKEVGPMPPAVRRHTMRPRR
jgi:hypothetical protein